MRKGLQATLSHVAALPLDELLDRYAEILIGIGLNVQPGHRPILQGPLEAAPLLRRCAACCYRAGALDVHVQYSDAELALVRHRHAEPAAFGEQSRWLADGFARAVEAGAPVLHLLGEDAHALAPFDPELVARDRAATDVAYRAFRSLVSANAVPWCVAGTVTAAWAARVFPELDAAAAADRLWRDIALVTRVVSDDPVAAWHAHVAAVEARCAVLNLRAYDGIRFRGPQTDLTVGLATGHRWLGVSEDAADGTRFIANIPSEEIYTAPDPVRTDGHVTLTRTASISGQPVRGVRLRFAAGTVVEAHAEQGQAVLDGLLRTDDGARRLGEVALVAASSLIPDRLYYEALFDENAASHIALGDGYPTTVRNGSSVINASLVHEDVMIGSSEMRVDGVRADGSLEQIMLDGEFTL